jgi:hypothetical protein
MIPTLITCNKLHIAVVVNEGKTQDSIHCLLLRFWRVTVLDDVIARNVAFTLGYQVTCKPPVGAPSGKRDTQTRLQNW